eukprot:4571626-Pleurochrysis_carterae.AAC.7
MQFEVLELEASSRECRGMSHHANDFFQPVLLRVLFLAHGRAKHNIVNDCQSCVQSPFRQNVTA